MVALYTLTFRGSLVSSPPLVDSFHITTGLKTPGTKDKAEGKELSFRKPLCVKASSHCLGDIIEDILHSSLLFLYSLFLTTIIMQSMSTHTIPSQIIIILSVFLSLVYKELNVHKTY